MLRIYLPSGINYGVDAQGLLHAVWPLAIHTLGIPGAIIRKF